MTSSAPHLGVLAFGDSITNGGGELQWGVALQSWALWTARALGLPYTGYAVDGATIADVVDAQIPAFMERAADPEGPYDVGCLYIGVNDVRRPGFDPGAFRPRHASALAFLQARCERVVCLTAPGALGRPPAPPASVAALNRVVRDGARERGALIVSLEDFGARNQLMVDRVHPTALGQVAIARRALGVLSADGMTVRVDPATLVAPSRSWSGALRGDWTYVYRDAKLRARARLRAARR